MLRRSSRFAAPAARRLAVAALLLTAPAGATAQQPATATTAALTAPLPLDPHVTTGQLSNGLRYFIRANTRPAKRAELRLVIRAGSVLEDPDQRGLAHFVEHMAFNGTKRFAKNALVSYLEKIGMRFGPDINAQTGFDETVYMLQVPTDTPSVMRTAFQILEDWSHGVSFDQAEIDKERGVVIEEWRLGRGADARMFDKQLPILLRGSRYAERLPIGDTVTLATFKRETLVRFYHDWYRPDLMAVIAVGDFDVAAIEKLVRDHFTGLVSPPNPRPRTKFGVPDHDSTLIAIASDKEATSSTVGVYFKQPRRPQGTHNAYRQSIVQNLFTQMLNQRFEEIVRKPDAPFVNAGAGMGGFIGDRDAFTLTALVDDNGAARGLEAILTEGARVRQHGFTQTELDREKQNFMRGMERVFAERDKSESESFAEELARHVTNDEPVPGIAYEFDLYKRFVPTITLAEENRLAGEWITDRNRVITTNTPEKAGLTAPNAAALMAVFDATAKKAVPAYTDGGATGALLEQLPSVTGTITATSAVKEIGSTTWTLSNGVRVILKPTDFKDDQILFRAVSPGGSSLLDDARFARAGQATMLVTQGGVGRFSLVDLQKALTGKAVSVAPAIGELTEGMTGGASPKDMETLFQLIYLYFTSPRADSSAVLALKQRVKAVLANRSASPEAVFADTVQVTLTNHHPRARPINEAWVDSLDLSASLAFYRDRYADASDFAFVFVGNFSLDSIKPYVLRYLGGLPSLRRKENWRDVGIVPPAGVVTREVRKGSEPKSETQLVFGGPFTWTRENRYALSSLAEVLRIRLREVLREDLGGTYGVDVGATPQREPRQRYSLSIDFSSAPDRAGKLRDAVFTQIDSLVRAGPTADEVEKVREMQRRGEETQLRENAYWLSVLTAADREGTDPTLVLQGAALRATLTRDLVRAAARQYLDIKNYIQLVLLPERAATPQDRH